MFICRAIESRLLLPLIMATACLFLGHCQVSAATFREAFEHAKELQASGDEEGAINNYVMAASLAPSPLNDARLALARIYAKLGRYNDAENEWQQMLSVTNKSVTLQYEYGAFLLNEGKFNSALSVWSDVLGQNPNDVTALYYMGVCMEATDNIDSAQSYYQKAATLSPTSQYGILSNQKLSRLGHATEQRATSKFFPVDLELGTVGLGWWNLLNMPLHVYIDDGTGVTGYRSDMRQYVLKAIEAWRQASGGKITFVLDPPDARNEQMWNQAFGKDVDPGRRITLSRSLPDDPVKCQIHVHWTQYLYGALGLTWTNPFANSIDANGFRDSLITHGHIWLNTNSMADGTPLPVNITAANSAILDKQDRIMSEVATHEFGHVLGLIHSPNPKDVMCSGIFAMNSTDRVDARTLSFGDAQSLAEHYNHFEGTGFPIQSAKETPGLNNNVVASTESGGSSAPGSPAGAAVNSFAFVRPVPKVVVDINNVVFDINTKQFDQGLSKLEKILKNEPKNAWAHYLRAVIYVMQHKYNEAATDYHEVLKLSSAGGELSKRASEGLLKLKSK